jgi:hypothetical protein
MRAKFLKVRRLAARLAKKCDFCTFERIAQATASCGANDIIVCVEYKDEVERTQIVTAFVYGSDLHQLNFSCSRSDDYGIAKYDGKGELLPPPNDKVGIVTIVLDCITGEGK